MDMIWTPSKDVSKSNQNNSLTVLLRLLTVFLIFNSVMMECVGSIPMVFLDIMQEVMELALTMCSWRSHNIYLIFLFYYI